MKKTIIAAVIAGTMLLSGCSGVSQESYNSVVAENEGLKFDNNNLKSENNLLKAENDELKKEKEELQEKLHNPPENFDSVSSNRIKPSNITPENVRTVDIILAQFATKEIISSFDEIDTISEPEKKVVVGALNTIMCYLDVRNGTNYYDDAREIIEKVVFGNGDEQEKSVVSSTYNTLLSAEFEIENNRYSSIDNTIKTMKTLYGKDVIGDDNNVKLNNDVDLSSLAVDCFYLAELLIEDTEKRQAELSPGSQGLLGGTSAKIVDSIKNSQKNIIISLAKISYGVETSDEEIVLTEKNIGYLIGMGAIS